MPKFEAASGAHFHEVKNEKLLDLLCAAVHLYCKPEGKSYSGTARENSGCHCANSSGVPPTLGDPRDE